MRSLFAFVLGAAVATIFLTQKRPVWRIKSAEEREEDVIERFLLKQDRPSDKHWLH
jgi:hypothetical protein